MRGWLCSMVAVGVCAVGGVPGVQAKTVTITFDEIPETRFGDRFGNEPNNPSSLHVKGVTFRASTIVPNLPGQTADWIQGVGTFGPGALGTHGDPYLYHFQFDEAVTSFSFDLSRYTEVYVPPTPPVEPHEIAATLQIFRDRDDVFKPVYPHDGSWPTLTGTPEATFDIIYDEVLPGPIGGPNVIAYHHFTYSGPAIGGFTLLPGVLLGGVPGLDNLTYTTANGGGGVIPTPAAAGIGLALLAGAATRRRR